MAKEKSKSQLKNSNDDNTGMTRKKNEMETITNQIIEMQ